MIASSLWLLVTPVYFFASSVQFKLFIDRWISIPRDKTEGKQALGIVRAGRHHDGDGADDRRSSRAVCSGPQDGIHRCHRRSSVGERWRREEASAIPPRPPTRRAGMPRLFAIDGEGQ